MKSYIKLSSYNNNIFINFKWRRDIFFSMLFLTVLFVMIFVHKGYAAEINTLSVDSAVINSVTFDKIKNLQQGDEVLNYSGKTVMWEGELLRKIDNDAYFEYILQLNTKDELRILSGRGIRYKAGDYVRVTGMILVKDGRFSHLVLNNIEAIPRELPQDYLAETPGLIGLAESDNETAQYIYQWIVYYNRGVSYTNAQFISERIVHYSRKYGQDPYLVTALMSAESAFNMQAISPAGAIGLGQLMPGTASMLGVNPYHPEQNIEGSVRYLSHQMQRWRNSAMQIALALASYNAGPGAVERFHGIPPYQETIEYVNYVSALYYKIIKK